MLKGPSIHDVPTSIDISDPFPFSFSQLISDKRTLVIMTIHLVVPVLFLIRAVVLEEREAVGLLGGARQSVAAVRAGRARQIVADL